MPEISGLPFEAHQGMVRGAAPLARIVAQARFLLVPVQGQHRRVQVEQHAAQLLGTLTQLREQAIVQPAELGQPAQREAAEESAQRSRIRIGGQPDERLEDAVPAQQLGRFETPQAEDDWIQERQQHFRDGVTIVALRESHSIAKALAQAQPVEESMEQKHPTIPSQAVACERDSNVREPATMAHHMLQNEAECPATITSLQRTLSWHRKTLLWNRAKID